MTIGAREGKFPGMLEHRKFHIVYAGEDHGAAIELSKEADAIIEYSGKAVTISH